MNTLLLRVVVHTPLGKDIRSEIIARKLVAEGDKGVTPKDPVMSNAEGFELVAKTQEVWNHIINLFFL